ncbi:MFS transporter (plasmid) [Pseudomonas silvicola]|nr:MFS transporter [Pseudomonas silvicola]
MFLGVFLGTLLIANLADRIGRKKVFIIALLVYAIASGIMAFQHHPFSIVFWRIVSGIGVGAELVTIDALCSEFIPARLRGRSYAFVQAIQYTSIPTIAFLSWQSYPQEIPSPERLRKRRAVSARCWCDPAHGLPESPRWLVEQGRYKEAERGTQTRSARG